MFNPFSKIKQFFVRKSVEKSLKILEPEIAKLIKRGGNMKGWRTLLVNGGLAALAAFLYFIIGIDLTQYGLNGTTATIVMAVVNFILRAITTTPIGIAGGR